MSLKFVLLTSLAQRNMTGYELAKEHDRVTGYFWRATHQQIYRELKKLVADNLVEFDEIAQTDKPDKKIYRIIEAGVAALREWLAKPFSEKPFNSALLVRFMAGEYTDLAGLHRDIAVYKAEYSARLQIFETIEKEEVLANNVLDSMPAQLKYITLRQGIIMSRAAIEWANETEQRLQAIAASQME